ncbi:MAG: glucose-6-phosphate isomerase [Halobacteriovoraceae bacterium]|nr:glucose-6-phosphate isomerase [Halobacteriovoraceae bacterium]|tara:strand:+ start:1099 stop:2364 length:1266 start_codon:yes stop_codon:yes gene_type:complete
MSIDFHYHTTEIENKNYKDHELFHQFKKTIAREDIGFFQLTTQTELLNQTKDLYEKFRHKKHIIQIGIGGSALGPQMLVNALTNETERTFTLLDNVDADYIHRELNKISLQEGLFYVVSKSGGTAETLACYAIVRNLLLKQGIKEEEFASYFVFCTEDKDSELMQHIKDNQYDFLEIPLNIGGRFSVLSPVGLFPACFFGIAVDELWQGAEAIKTNLLNEDLNQNSLVQTASRVLELYHQGVNQTVLMPYSSILRDLSFWFVQLWAESLGKWSEAQQKHIGLTPVPAYGATDQHSQVQLFMEGPSDKLIFLLSTQKTKTDYALASNLPLARAQKLSDYSLNQLMLAEFKGTLKALKENKKQVIELNLDKISAHNLGGLILFFESLTTMVGEALKIDPFNQPGVEKGKIYAFSYLEKGPKVR